MRSPLPYWTSKWLLRHQAEKRAGWVRQSKMRHRLLTPEALRGLLEFFVDLSERSEGKRVSPDLYLALCYIGTQRPALFTAVLTDTTLDGVIPSQLLRLVAQTAKYHCYDAAVNLGFKSSFKQSRMTTNPDHMATTGYLALFLSLLPSLSLQDYSASVPHIVNMLALLTTGDKHVWRPTKVPWTMKEAPITTNALVDLDSQALRSAAAYLLLGALGTLAVAPATVEALLKLPKVEPTEKLRDGVEVVDTVHMVLTAAARAAAAGHVIAIKPLSTIYRHISRQESPEFITRKLYEGAVALSVCPNPSTLFIETLYIFREYQSVDTHSRARIRQEGLQRHHGSLMRALAKHLTTPPPSIPVCWFATHILSAVDVFADMTLLADLLARQYSAWDTLHTPARRALLELSAGLVATSPALAPRLVARVRVPFGSFLAGSMGTPELIPPMAKLLAGIEQEEVRGASHHVFRHLLRHFTPHPKQFRAMEHVGQLASNFQTQGEAVRGEVVTLLVALVEAYVNQHPGLLIGVLPSSVLYSIYILRPEMCTANLVDRVISRMRDVGQATNAAHSETLSLGRLHQGEVWADADLYLAGQLQQDLGAVDNDLNQMYQLQHLIGAQSTGGKSRKQMAMVVNMRKAVGEFSLKAKANGGGSMMGESGNMPNVPEGSKVVLPSIPNER